jgi:hypothetical protein
MKPQPPVTTTGALPLALVEEFFIPALSVPPFGVKVQGFPSNQCRRDQDQWKVLPKIRTE